MVRGPDEPALIFAFPTGGWSRQDEPALIPPPHHEAGCARGIRNASLDLAKPITPTLDAS